MFLNVTPNLTASLTVNTDFAETEADETFDYSRSALEGFRRATGGTDLLGGPARSPREWDGYRRQGLTALATRLADAARAERPGLVISAAVAPDEAQAVSQKFQDWPRWLASGLIGALCRMTYTPDNDIFRQPSAVLDAIKGIDRVELSRHGTKGFCCGGGGGHMWMEEPPDKRPNLRRTDEVIQTKVNAVATACPYCLSMFEDGLKAREVEESIKALDLSELVARALPLIPKSTAQPAAGAPDLPADDDARASRAV